MHFGGLQRNYVIGLDFEDGINWIKFEEDNSKGVSSGHFMV